MRPKLLEIEGLQSFRDVQGIDFEALSETGLFGIFGPTGSGKSTVLDAITFALYGKVKRAEGGTQGIINSNLNTAKVSFSFELLKDGSRKNYRVERTYQRKKGSENSCEPKIARLIEVTEIGEIPLCDKATEVSNNIKELLGLSHEDFTRAVVLPQNSFQEFLLLNNSDRRKMLERIFYLEEYGEQLLFKLNQKMVKLKSRIDILSGELKGYADATDEALEEAQKAMNTAASERNKALTELKLLETKFSEAKEVWSLVQELSHVNQKEQQHVSFGEAVKVKRNRLEKAVKADSLLEMIRKSKELHEKLQETEKQLEKVLKILPGVITGLNEIRLKYEGIKSEAGLEQPKLVGFRTRLVGALSIQEEIRIIIEKIKQHQGNAKKLKDASSDKNDLIKKETFGLNQLEQNFDKLKSEIEPLKIDPDYRQQIQNGAKLESEVRTLSINVNELGNKAGTLNSAATVLEQRLNGIREKISLSQRLLADLTNEKQKHEILMPEDRNSVIKYKEKIHSYQAVYDVLKLRKNELNVMDSKIAKQQSALTELTQKALLLDKSKEKAGVLYEQCKLELENAIGEMDRSAAHMLSKNLKEGEPCPVCGSEHHPNPVAMAEDADMAMLEQQVEKSREKLDDADKALKEAEKTALVAGEQVRALTGQNIQAVQDQEFKAGEYNVEKLRLPEELRDLDTELIRMELERMNDVSTEKLKAIETWEKKLEEFKEKLQKLNDTMSGHRLIENGIITELKVNRESLEQMEKSFEEAKKILRERQQMYSEFLQQYKIQSADAELNKLAENDRKMNALQKQMEQARENIGNKKILLEKYKEELRLINADCIKVEADINNLNGQKSEKEIKLKELVGDTNIKDEIKRIDEKLGEYVMLEKQFNERLQLLEKQHNELETQKSLLANQQNIYSESLKNEDARLNTALLEKGFTDSSEVEKSVIPMEKQDALKNEIKEYDKTGLNIQAQREMVQKKLNSRNITEEEWIHTSNAYLELAAFKEECVSRSEVARNNFNTLKNKHDKWLELNKSYNELSHKQGLFEQIQKILRAEHRRDNSFIDYIAEERLRYVAAKASDTLGVMTKYKYALELDTDAGFIIRDNANGGVHRMVTSLSGGETFLTSLSLALALSEQIQLKGQSPLEFFFLDEGFGTLDNDLLDTVIDSLERLSSKERVIGLISHVPELRSRIGRRLIVDPPTSQGDGSMVRVEKA